MCFLETESESWLQNFDGALYEFCEIQLLAGQIVFQF